MRIYLVMMFFGMMLTEAWASGSELFPLPQLRLGMKAEDFITAYPNAKQGMITKDKEGNITDGIALCEIKDGQYWDSALIKIKDSQVDSWSYVRTKDFEKARKDVGKVFKVLKQELGKDEKKVSRQLLKQGKVRSPAFIWKRDNDFVVFSHSPVKLYKSGEPFICRLTVALNDQAVRELFDIADDKKDDDSQLFQEVTDAASQSDSQ